MADTPHIVTEVSEMDQYTMVDRMLSDPALAGMFPDSDRETHKKMTEAFRRGELEGQQPLPKKGCEHAAVVRCNCCGPEVMCTHTANEQDEGECPCLDRNCPITEEERNG